MPPLPIVLNDDVQRMWLKMREIVNNRDIEEDTVWELNQVIDLALWLMSPPVLKPKSDT